MGAPSQDLARQTDCLTVLCSQEAPFGSTYDFAPEETHAEEPHGDTDYDWKTAPSSKGNRDICFFFQLF